MNKSSIIIESIKAAVAATGLQFYTGASYEALAENSRPQKAVLIAPYSLDVKSNNSAFDKTKATDTYAIGVAVKNYKGARSGEDALMDALAMVGTLRSALRALPIVFDATKNDVGILRMTEGRNGITDYVAGHIIIQELYSVDYFF